MLLGWSCFRREKLGQFAGVHGRMYGTCCPSAQFHWVPTADPGLSISPAVACLSLHYECALSHRAAFRDVHLGAASTQNSCGAIE